MTAAPQRVGIALASILLVALSESAALATPRPTVRAQVSRFHRAYHDAVAARDPSAVADLYTRDAWYMPPTSPAVHGRAAIRLHFVTLFKRGLCGFSWITRAIHVSGALVVDFGRYSTSLCAGRRVTTRINGGYVVTLRRQSDNSLRLLYDIFTAA